MTALWRNERGAISVFAAGIMLLMIGMTALVVDVGLWYLKRRELQNATDAAALAAVQNTTNATAIAASLMAQNGFADTNITAVTPGYYCDAPSVTANNRFSTTRSALPACAHVPVNTNAVRIDSFVDAPVFFARPFLSATNQSKHIMVTATATRLDAAGLRAGTGVASISTADSLLMNAVTNSLLGGGNVGLTAGHYNALAGVDIDARKLMGALAIELDMQSGTYRQLQDSQVAVDQLLSAAIATMAQPGSGADAATAIAGMQLLQGKIPASRTIRFGDLFGLGVWQDRPVGGPAAINAGINTLQLATAAIQLANGQNAIASAETVTLPGGLASATLEISAIEPPQQPYFAFGPAGTRVHTAQVRTKMTMQLIGQTVQLPFYIELGSGDAAISRIDCGANPAVDAKVYVAAKSAVANVYLGSVSASSNAMKNFSTPVMVSPAWLLNVSVPLVGTVGVGFSAHMPVGSSAETTLLFSRQGSGPLIGIPPSLGTKGQVSSSAMSSTLGNGLLSSLTITTNPLNLGGVVSALGAVTGLINTTIQPLLNLLDPTLDVLFKALGVKVGFMDVWVPGVRCGVPVLVH